MSSPETPPYEERILDHYEDPYHRGPLEHATHSSEGTNPLCGDTFCVQLRIASDGAVHEGWFDGEGCVVSQAAGSMLMERIEGMTRDEVQEFSATKMLELFGASLVANRQKCCLLPWRVMQSALASPMIDDDLDDEPNFGGPSLSEEC
ncbi:MAG: iron-sulfur cluster assembly scaffold protein [Pirellulaceae bacterium]|nr:iron-sulfur cluster assembly scaffold protein [Pirellulaceae bacterium]